MEEELFDIKSRFGEYPSYKVTKIRRDMVTIGNMQVCDNSISRDNQQPSYNLNGYKRFRD